ncbi:MAG: lysozyme inhibitor LprI family protein [Pseudomonadota bacterium]
MNNMIKNSFLTTFLFFSHHAISDNYYESINKTQEKCLSNPNTISNLDIIECYEDSYNSWDKMLNKEFQLMMKDQELTPDFKLALKKSQQAWIKYKSLADESINRFYDNQQGSYWKIVALINKNDLTKNKAIELYNLRISTKMEN